MSNGQKFSDLFSNWAAHLDEQQAIAAAEAMKFGLQSGSLRPIGGGEPLSLQGAALVNGVRAHAIDFDDYKPSGSRARRERRWGGPCDGPTV